MTRQRAISSAIVHLSALLTLMFLVMFTVRAWGQGEIRYSVKKGETLESIAKREYGDQSLWVLLWDTNKNLLQGVVNNPDQKIPAGTEIIIPKLKTVKAETKANKTGEEEAIPKVLAHVQNIPAVSPLTILMGGYITPVQERPYGMVMGSSRTGKMQLGTGDRVHIRSFGPMLNPGERYLCVRDWEPVYHPWTGEFMGFLRKITGIIKVLCFQYPDGEAVVETASPTPVTAGDRIFLLKGMPMAIDHVFHATIEKEGAIVELYEPHMTESEDFEYLYIDIGKKDGLLPGTVLYVLKETPIVHTVGRVVVLSTQEHTSTAILVEFSDPIRRGMRVTSHVYCPPIKEGEPMGIPECSERPAPPTPPPYKPHYPGEIVPVKKERHKPEANKEEPSEQTAPHEPVGSRGGQDTDQGSQ